MTALLAAIPPPPFSEFHLGPLTIRMYGILIGLGVLAAVWLAGKLMEERNVGTTDDAGYIALWGVAAGVVGARFYHVITTWSQYKDNIGDAFKFWTPGLGIPGGILFGTLAGLWAAKRRGVPLLATLSCAAPAVPLAQSIGRLGNYFNQELYGRPTSLPWGLRVDAAHIPQSIRAEFPTATVFQPTFLYESLWNLALCLALVWLFRNRPRLQPGRLFPLYLVGYGVGRLWIESLRIDPANKIGPFRVNIWMSLSVIIGGAAWFILSRNSTERWPAPAHADGAVAEDAPATATHDGGQNPISTAASRDSLSAAESTRTAERADAPSDDQQASTYDAAAHRSADTGRASDETSQRVDQASDDTSSPATSTAAMASDSTPAPERPSGDKGTSKKTGTKQSAVKKAGTKKSPAKKSATKKSATKKSATKKSPAKKSATKKSPAKKSATKKSPAKKSATKKSPAKKSATKKSATKKSGAIDPGLSMGSDAD